MSRMRWTDEEYKHVVAEILRRREAGHNDSPILNHQIQAAMKAILPEHRWKYRLTREVQERVHALLQTQLPQAAGPTTDFSTLDYDKLATLVADKLWARMKGEVEHIEAAPAAVPTLPTEEGAPEPTDIMQYRSTTTFETEKEADRRQGGAGVPPTPRIWRVAIMGYHPREVAEMEAQIQRLQLPIKAVFKHPDHDTAISKWLPKVSHCELIVCRTKYAAHNIVHALKSNCTQSQLRWLDNHGWQSAIAVVQSFLELNKSRSIA